VQRFQSQYGLPEYDARILCGERAMADFFERCARHFGDYKKLSNWFLGELLRLLKEEGGAVSTLKFSAEQLAELLSRVDKGEVSANAGKGVLAEMFRTGKAPGDIISEKGLAQVSDSGAVASVIDEVLAKNAPEVEKYRAGNKKAFGFFVGQVMKAMKGKGNPAVVNELLKKKLGDSQ
jgi:aspartyl-tRNA(Asn)/glutamyl-tRNA(Gln) amidotransferase subunit B